MNTTLNNSPDTYQLPSGFLEEMKFSPDTKESTPADELDKALKRVLGTYASDGITEAEQYANETDIETPEATEAESATASREQAVVLEAIEICQFAADVAKRLEFERAQLTKGSK